MKHHVWLKRGYMMNFIRKYNLNQSILITSNKVKVILYKLNYDQSKEIQRHYISIKNNSKSNSSTTLNIFKIYKNENIITSNTYRQWMHTNYMANFIKTNKLIRCKYYKSSAIIYNITSKHSNEIKQYYITNKSIPENKTRSIDIYNTFISEDLIKSSCHSLFIRLKSFREYVYEENISKLTYYVNSALIKGYYFTKKQVNEFRIILLNVKNGKNKKSNKVTNLLSRIRQKYNKNKMKHLYTSFISNCKKSHVYCITNKLNNRQYIGVWKHTSRENYICSGEYCLQDILKYKPINFKKDILYEDFNYKKILKKEQYYIALYKTNKNRKDHFGYNQTDGGEDCGHNRKSVIIYDYFNDINTKYDSITTASLKLNISKGVIDNFINRTRRNNTTPYPIKGQYIITTDIKLLPNLIKQLEKSGRFNAYMPVLCINKYTMQIICEYSTATEACKKLNITTPNCIVRLCTGKCYATVTGHFWIFKKDKHKLKDLFKLFHINRSKKVIIRANIINNNIKYYDNMKIAAIDNGGLDCRFIQHKIDNDILIKNKYKFNYII